MDGLNDGLTSDDDDHELLRDIDCLDGGEIDGDIDNHGPLVFQAGTAENVSLS